MPHHLVVFITVFPFRIDHLLLLVPLLLSPQFICFPLYVLTVLPRVTGMLVLTHLMRMLLIIASRLPPS